MTDEQLAEWQRLFDAATPGKWIVKTDVTTIHGSHFINPGVWGDDGITFICDCGTGSRVDTDAAFIVAAREAVPALIAEVRRLKTELATARMYSTVPPAFGSEGYADWMAAKDDREWAKQKRTEVTDPFNPDNPGYAAHIADQDDIGDYYELP